MASRRSSGRKSAGGPMAPTDAPHIPVLLAEVLERLNPQSNETYIDATFGAGGYTRAILDHADCRLLALDRDPTAIVAGADLVTAYAPRLDLVMAPFSIMQRWTDAQEVNTPSVSQHLGQYDGIVFDLGVSSMQLDEGARGFSFQADGPLDMRMFATGEVHLPSTQAAEEGPSASDVVNTYDEAELADILFQLGEEKRSRAIARAIIARRTESTFTRTLDLADVVAGVLGGRRGEARHPATKTFQALRMYVNDELGELVRGLVGAERCLKPGGRLVVVTFHSLEDRIVKRFMAKRAGRDAGISRHMPQAIDAGPKPSFRIVNHPALTSRKGEIAVNPRARSARLRSVERTDVPAWPFETADLGLPAITRRGL